MPVSNPGGGGGSGIVSVDGSGFVVVGGGADTLPLKISTQDMGGGTTRFNIIANHPTLGEIVVAYKDETGTPPPDESTMWRSGLWRDGLWRDGLWR